MSPFESFGGFHASGNSMLRASSSGLEYAMFLEFHSTQEDARCRLHAPACGLHCVSRTAKRPDQLTTHTSLYTVC